MKCINEECNMYGESWSANQVLRETLIKENARLRDALEQVIVRSNAVGDIYGFARIAADALEAKP
jgi:hypothetical protein